MKKIIVLIMPFLLLCGCTAQVPQQITEKTTKAPEKSEYVKAVWIAYYELQELMSVNENQFRENIEKAFKNLKNMGFNTACVQVRPCADAFYYSKYFPVSKYCFGRQGSDLPFDPLSVMCSAAKDTGIEIEAWVNPYRVSQDNKVDELAESNIARIWLDNEKTESYVYKSKSAIYFNPAVEDVTELIVNGVKEIAENYDISAIHFDDYFYPTTNKNIDKKQYDKNKKYIDILNEYIEDILNATL